MDPYLEDPGLWPDVHHGLISEIQASLNNALGPRYRCRIGERVYVSDEDDPARAVLVPDLHIAKRPARGAEGQPAQGAASGSVRPVLLTTLLADEIREARVEIVDRDGRQVVTVIEVLSPANKVTGARGRDSFLAKRREVMTSSAHWVEIDLLRTGQRLVPASIASQGDYFVHVSEASQRPQGLVWPIRLEQCLPSIAIPLRERDAPASLDLQAVLNRAYERGRYDREVDYDRDPVPPLPTTQAAWARTRTARAP